MKAEHNDSDFSVYAFGVYSYRVREKKTRGNLSNGTTVVKGSERLVGFYPTYQEALAAMRGQKPTRKIAYFLRHPKRPLGLPI